MMRKWAKVVLAGLLFLGQFGVVAVANAAEVPTKEWRLDAVVMVDEARRDVWPVGGAAAFQRWGTTYVPAKVLAEQFGLALEFQAEEQRVVLRGSVSEVWFSLNSASALVLNDQGVTPYGEKSFVLDGRAYVPLRFAAESIGLTVAYDVDAGRTMVTGKMVEGQVHYGYQFSADQQQVISAIKAYDDATMVSLHSNMPGERLEVVITRSTSADGDQTVRNILSEGRMYQATSRQTRDVRTEGVVEVCDMVIKPVKLLGGDPFTRLENFSANGNLRYCIEDVSHEKMAEGTRYDIKKIEGQAADVSLYLNQEGQIIRWIQRSSEDGTVFKDFSVVS